MWRGTGGKQPSRDGNPGAAKSHISFRGVHYLERDVAIPSPKRATSDMHQIGEVAERVELSLRTVRYYEEVGLIAPERRTDGGFRLYTEENIDRLRLIMQMKPLGFSVEEMRAVLEALDMLGSPDSDASARQAADQLREFAEFAERRCAKMRGHRAGGEKLVEQLARSARRY